MNKKEEIHFKAFILESIREWFKSKNIVEARYPQFSFAGSCENAPTTYWLEKDEEFLMLPQTRQIMAEDDLIRHGLDAVYMMQTSYRDEPRAGDGRHTNQFLLTEMEHKNMTQDELIQHEIEMLKFMIKKSLEYFEKNPGLTTKRNIARLKYTLEVDIPIVTYTDMIDKLQEKGISVNWGDDFSSTAEEFICALHADIPIPVVVKDYPEKLKYFNMYLDRKTEGTDRETVECADLLLPFAGETWGSSRRENEYERIKKRFYTGTMYKQLKERLEDKLIENNEPDDEEEVAEKIINDAFEPYFNLFKDEPHDRAGYGLGTGRLAQFILGRNSIVEI
jgi:aspartyl/asparaginyl-tRNA synthetase